MKPPTHSNLASGLHVAHLHSAKVANLWNCQVKSVDAACFEVIVERRVEVEQLRASLASCNSDTDSQP